MIDLEPGLKNKVGIFWDPCYTEDSILNKA
jgi:hypothetical protein